MGKGIERFRPSGAMVVACIALTVALGGSAVATGFIDGKNLKNHSVLGAKLKNNAVGEEQIGWGAVTARQIAQGAVRSSEIAPGAITASKLATGVRLPSLAVRVLDAAVQPGPTGVVTHVCQAGEVALSGGYAGLPIAGVQVLADRPSPASGDAIPNGWTLAVQNSTVSPVVVEIYVVCAKPEE